MTETPVPMPQGELFLLGSPLTGEIRGDSSLMALPFSALSKNAWMKPLAYVTPSVSIEVRLSARGVATIYDKEIVPYIASLMASKIDDGDAVSQDFTFTAHDLFSVTGSNHSARSYSRLADAVERLQGTQIRTNIEAGREGEEGFFSWLSEARVQYPRSGKKGEKRLKAVKVRLCERLFRAILRDRQVLGYAHTYFSSARSSGASTKWRAAAASTVKRWKSTLRPTICRSDSRTSSPISAWRFARSSRKTPSRTTIWSWWRVRKTLKRQANVAVNQRRPKS